MKKMLVVDVGNTNVKYALMHGVQVNRFWSHPTTDTAGRCAEVLAETNVPVALSSVVPDATSLIRDNASTRKFIEVTATTQRSLKAMPAQMGTDRVAAALAAWKLYGNSKRAVVSMTFGTATTLLAVNKYGEQKGGWIHPGVSMTLEALHRCALLPLFKMEEPSSALGYDTATHMRNGVFVGHLGVVREYIACATRQLNGWRRPLTIATGGWAKALQEHGGLFDVVDDELTLRGIYLMACEAGL